MVPGEFNITMGRLESAFGKNFFNEERKRLIWKGVNDLTHAQFQKLADKFIRTTRSAPLPVEIIEAAHHERKNGFYEDVKGAAKIMHEAWPQGLKIFLAKEYPGCSTLNQAVEVQVLRNQIKQVDTVEQSTKQDKDIEDTNW